MLLRRWRAGPCRFGLLLTAALGSAAGPAAAQEIAARLQAAQDLVAALDRPGEATAAGIPGADPAGRRDSAPAFQAAASRGGDVALPCGRFVLSRAVTLSAPARWVGQGDCTVLTALPGNRSDLFTIQAASDVLVAAMTLDGNRDAIGNDTPLATAVDSARVLFAHIVVQRTRGVGLTFSNATQSGVSTGRFRDIGTFNGGRPLGPGGPVDPSFPRSAWMAVDFNDRGGSAPDERDRGNFVLDSDFAILGGSAVAAGQQIGFIFARNRVDNSASGWTAGQQAALGTSFAGIYLNLTAGSLVAANRISGVSGDAIDTWENSGLAIAGNLVSGNGLAGINVAGPAEGFAVLGNVSEDNDRAVGLRPGNTHENAAITFGAQPLMAPALVSDGVVAGNIAIGTTGLQAFPHVSLRRVWIDPSNVLGRRKGPVRSSPAQVSRQRRSP